MKQEQRLQDIQNIKTTRTELLALEEQAHILEAKRDYYINILKSNEKVKAKSNALILSTISNEDKRKLQQNCQDITEKNIEIRNKIEEYNRRLFEQTKKKRKKEQELDFQKKMFATSRNQDKKQTEAALNEIRLNKEKLTAKLDKTKNSTKKAVLQKRLEVLNRDEKYYLKENELRDKSAQLLQKQEITDLKQQQRRFAELSDQITREMKAENSSLFAQEIKINEQKTTSKLMQEKLLEFKKVDKRIKTQRETPELLAQKKSVELDVKILSTRDRIEKLNEKLAQAKEANAKKLKDTEKRFEATSDMLSALNKQIADEKDKSQKKILLARQEKLKEQLLTYQTKTEEYEEDMMFFENKQKYFNEEKQKLHTSYTTTIFNNESNKSNNYLRMKQELIKAYENKEALEKTAKDLQDEYELNQMLKEEEDRKIDEAIKNGDLSVANTATETKFASSVELSTKQTFVKWDAKKNKEAIAQQISDIEKIEKTLDYIENKPVVDANAEITYKEKSYEIEQKILNNIDTYCKKYLATEEKESTTPSTETSTPEPAKKRYN